MTELSTEPVVAPAPPTAPPPPPPDTSPAKAQEDVEHTPGGWPIVPLALSGANSTVGAVAAASLAGGPIAAAVAATGMVVLGTVAATRSRKPNPRRESRRAAARAAGRSAARSAGLRSNGAGSRGSSGSRSASSRAGRSGGRSGKVPGQHRRSTGPAAGHGSAATSKKARGKSGHSLSKHAAGKAVGRAGQVKALRAAQKAAGSRAGQRAQTTSARRAVADARRNAKAAAGSTRKRAGLAGRLMGGAVRKARAARDAAVAKQRAKRDAKNGGAVAAGRANVRKAPARRAARKALRRSAARFHGRRLLAGLLALPVGLIGCLSTWIGRKLGIPALMHPGRRLYRRMVQSAGEQRAERDEEARKNLREQEAAADAEAVKDGTQGIADSVERPAATVPTSTTPETSEGEHVSSSGFKFEDHATEMQAAAMLYEPDGCMEILAMVEGLPEALNMVAHVMQILAERSDGEFPLEKEVANGFNDIYDLLRKAAAGAEELPAIFRRVHEQDIARHEDPRNGTEAEKGWNV
ncbi:hypothetical protein [Streptomyces canus]|uniref:hypothetical protein n=1 Tax=Streptomyces canus TaxID=58343 RepID=UPI002E33AEE1|nr:hypothetical protein [Streptomyces canus]